MFLSVALSAGIRQHSTAIRKIKDIAVLTGVLDLPSSGSGNSAQPALQVFYVEFHDIHNAYHRACRARVNAGFHALPGVIEVQRIPIVTGCGTYDLDAPRAIGDSIGKFLQNQNRIRMNHVGALLLTPAET